MIVRTYGRRNRGLPGSYSDSFHDEDDSQDTTTIPSSSSSQDFFHTNNNNNSNNFLFSSQESSSFFPSLDPDPYAFDSSQETGYRDPGVLRKSKKPRNGKNSSRSSSSCSGFFPVTSTTLLEAQEFGEMMEHVDEVNFALDGLKKGQPVRIRRASLVSLLSICGTAHQRRLLRTQGVMFTVICDFDIVAYELSDYAAGVFLIFFIVACKVSSLVSCAYLNLFALRIAKTIIDAILGLSFDDSISNLAAAALFYALTNDGQDDHLLESPRCIRFLIKLLKPVITTSTADKTRNIGSKLLALRKDPDVLCNTRKVVDSSSAAILAKVQEILVSCKEIEPHDCVDDNGVERPELSPKWIALLTLEKACLSKISLEDTSGTARKMGGDFKERLRELGGLDTVFEVAMNCHSVLEQLSDLGALVSASSHDKFVLLTYLQSWTERGSPPMKDGKDNLHLQSLVLLLKCLKIMENATFLSDDNQNHLLGLKKHMDYHGRQLSFTKLIISAIKILSSLYLLKKSSGDSSDGNSLGLSDGRHSASDLAKIAGYKVDSNEDICIISSSNSCSAVGISSEISLNASQKSIAQLSLSASGSETTTTFVDDTSQLKLGVNSSTSSFCSERLGSCNGATPASNGSRRKLGLLERPKYPRDNSCELLEHRQDPYAFDEDEFPSSDGSRRKLSLLERPKYPRDNSSELLEHSQDPYAFDEDEFQPSKWDLLSGKKKISKAQNGRVTSREHEDGDHYHLMSQEESSNNGNCQQNSDNRRHHDAEKNSCSMGSDGELSGLLQDCLLTAVKVLMNLTNDNPVGCRQIAAYGGLETMSSLIAGHFPFYSSSISLFTQIKENISCFEVQHDNGSHLSDQELDLLVAILGLLHVNCRSRLAATSVSLPSSEGLEEESQGDLIPLLCTIFLTNQGAGDASGDGNIEPWNDEAAMLQGEKEAEKMIIEAYAALLLAFLSTESKSIRDSIADCLPNQNLAVLVPVLERFLVFHLTLNMISPETHKAVSEVIESCKMS
ncbi:hypothetical protein Tsubulata_013822 [Turnera subulata]|uniref:Wings apart-like protein C-terminal domain-containing protein n=1 Tax=Turnera subulata TaxID=218843 RepID=A0A9Q0JRU2_9ROSI|nr:hypothetical protein Tsubulata_013822 [Turnera subulata]